MRVTITRNQDAIDVSVPFKLKERAKKIKGYRWNPESRVWSYPNDQAILSALIAEFGDDADVIGCPEATIGPETLAPTISNVHTEENSRLRLDIESLRTDLDVVSSERTNLQLGIRRLREEAALRDQELQQVRRQVDGLKTSSDGEMLRHNIEFWRGQAAACESKYIALVEKSNKPRSADPSPQPPPKRLPRPSDPFLEIVQRAIDLSGQDREFSNLVNNSTSSRLALDVATAVQKRLRVLLAVSDNGRMEFVSMIREAAERQIINDEARGLLNFIRHNRNRVAHDHMEPSVLWARSCIAMLAGAIVWQDLTRKRTSGVVASFGKTS